MGDEYRVRLKVRIGRGLTTEEASLAAQVAGREVTVKSANADRALKDASWLALGAGGFATNSEATDYGERLRRAADLAGLCTRVGVDGRVAGDDRPTSTLGPAGEDWLRSLGVLQAGQRVIADTHGLSVFPDDGNTRIFNATGTGRATHDAGEFMQAIEESAAEKVNDDVLGAVRVLNLAQINESPIAKVVLAISSIEALAATGGGWTKQQRAMIERTVHWVGNQFGGEGASREVADAIRRMHQLSLRQQARRLLKNHGLMDWWGKWNDVYGRRSRLFHGGAGREDGDVTELAQDAMKVCGGIVLCIAKLQGASLPSAAKLHFGVL